MALPLDELSLLDGPLAPGNGAEASTGAPLQIALDLIDEDPEQPRTEFDDEALRELADTIALRGVRQPISVRPHPRDAGRWMLNFGARRLRASRLAGRDTVPAFVDATADSFDQVIENEQRQSLTPLELALFVQRQLAAGQTLAEVGRRLGKSRTYMSFVAALIDAPDWLLQVYRSGVCRGLSDLYELRKSHQRAPEQVLSWIDGREAISRADIQALKSRIEEKADPRGEPTPPARAGAQEGGTVRKPPSPAHTASVMDEGPPEDRPVARRTFSAVETVVLEATWQGRTVCLALEGFSSADGATCLRAKDSEGHEVMVPVSEMGELRFGLAAR